MEKRSKKFFLENEKNNLKELVQIKEHSNYLSKQIQIYRQIFEKFTDGIYICDNIGQHVYYNESFSILSGITIKDLDKMENIYEAIKMGFIPNSCVAIVINTKEPASTIIQYSKGKKCLVSAYPLIIGNELLYVAAIVRDLTELNSLQNQLENEKELNKAYKDKLIEYQEKDFISQNIISNNRVIHGIYEKIQHVANLDCAIFLQGETGVGKDFLAKQIHNLRNTGGKGYFIKINCGAIPENLMESELFGYEKGAFTGADNKGKAGLFELANNGTIFLDEIGDMPLNMQVKLLNSIEDKQYFRVGGTKTIKLNARIIAATNKDIEALIKEKKFRLDLFYRLNLVTINIPSLKERHEDILPLSIKFLEEFNKKYRKNCYFSTEIMSVFLNYNWPGNIRELRNVIEKAVIMSRQDCIYPDFNDIILNNKNNTEITNFNLLNSGNNATLKSNLEFFESSYIKEQLTLHKTLQETANTLGIDLSTLVRKKRKYKL